MATQSGWVGMNCSPDLLCVLLCGGRSTRMKQDKTSLLLGSGATLKEKALSTIREACAHFPELRSEIFLSVRDGEGIRDLIPDAGPMGGVYSVFQAFSGPVLSRGHLLCVPIDMPCLSDAALAALIAARESAMAVHWDSYNLPFVCELSSASHRVLGELFSARGGNSLSVGRFLAGLGARALPVSEACSREFQNINYPEDYHALIRGTPQR